MRFTLCFYSHIIQMGAVWLERRKQGSAPKIASTFRPIYDKSREQTLKVQTAQRQGLLCLSSSLGHFEKRPDTHRHSVTYAKDFARHPRIQQILTHTWFTLAIISLELWWLVFSRTHIGSFQADIQTNRQAHWQSGRQRLLEHTTIICDMENKVSWFRWTGRSFHFFSVHQLNPNWS